MDSTFVRTLTIVGAVGSGLVAGVFFAFSTFVMSGLRRAPAPAGIAAMQSINRAGPDPAVHARPRSARPGSASCSASSPSRSGARPAATLALIAAVLSLVPVILTGAYHQPRNLAFGARRPDDARAPSRRGGSTWPGGCRGTTSAR